MEPMDASHLILMLQLSPGIGEKTVQHILGRNAILRRSPDEFLRLKRSELLSDGTALLWHFGC